MEIREALQERKNGTEEDAIAIANVIQKHKSVLETRRPGLAKQLLDLMNVFLRLYGLPAAHVKQAYVALCLQSLLRKNYERLGWRGSFIGVTLSNIQLRKCSLSRHGCL